MLPDKYCVDDKQWISEQLKRLPLRQRIAAIQGYSDAYQSAYDNEKQEHKKENAARFTANSRLRKFIDKVLTQ